MSEGFAAIERRTVVGDAIEQIKARLVTGALKPGERLPSERNLAELFRVSRPAVREAARALETLGVLETRPGAGTYVTNLSSDLLARPLAFLTEVSGVVLADLFDVRLSLEVTAARAAAQSIDEPALEELGVALSDLTSAAKSIERFVDCDIRFHRIIHRAAGNALLLALMENLSALDRQSRVITSQRRAVRDESIPEHENILRSLDSRDPDQAGEAMWRHLTTCWRHLDEDGLLLSEARRS